MNPDIIFDVITLFPKMFEPYFNEGVLGRAVKNNIIKVNLHQLRDFTQDKHKTVDDTPYGGGGGMILKPQPLAKAVNKIKNKKNSLVIYLSPRGKKLDQILIYDLLKYKQLVLVSGRYEGVDERFIENYVQMEISIGDYVLSGGELPAMVLIDAVSRFVKGVLGNNESSCKDSFSVGLQGREAHGGVLEAPQYTRPEIFEGSSVPGVLLSGNHKKIEEWKKNMSLEVTLKRRPDLIKR